MSAFDEGPGDADVFGLWRAGDRRRATDLLVRRHGRAVYSLCARVLKDPVSANDVMQQVFIEACRDFARFKGRSSLRQWLLGIAGHRCLDTIKGRQREAMRNSGDEQHAVSVADPADGPGEHLEQQERLRALEQCLAGLSDHVRATVLLRFQSGLSYEELSGELGEKPATLQARVARALPALRRCMEEKGLTP